MAARPGSDRLDAELSDAFGELFVQVVDRFDELARRFSLPAFALKALHILSSPMAMKELGRRCHCDPSFVTAIADMLDSHGLGRRETDPRDRRIKNLLLTPKGLQLRERVERELYAAMPWTHALDEDERECLLGLLRKMIKTEHQRRAGSATPAGTARWQDTGPRAAPGSSPGGSPQTTVVPPTATG